MTGRLSSNNRAVGEAPVLRSQSAHRSRDVALRSRRIGASAWSPSPEVLPSFSFSFVLLLNYRSDNRPSASKRQASGLLNVTVDALGREAKRASHPATEGEALVIAIGIAGAQAQ